MIQVSGPGQCDGVGSRQTGTYDVCAVLRGDARLSDTADGGGTSGT